MTLMIMTFKHQDTQHLCRELLVKIPHVMETAVFSILKTSAQVLELKTIKQLQR